jgi:hypothetical protein
MILVFHFVTLANIRLMIATEEFLRLETQSTQAVYKSSNEFK